MYRIEDHQELPPLKVTITHDRMLEAYRKSVKEKKEKRKIKEKNLLIQQVRVRKQTHPKSRASPLLLQQKPLSQQLQLQDVSSFSSPEKNHKTSSSSSRPPTARENHHEDPEQMDVIDEIEPEEAHNNGNNTHGSSTTMPRNLLFHSQGVPVHLPRRIEDKFGKHKQNNSKKQSKDHVVGSTIIKVPKQKQSKTFYLSKLLPKHCKPMQSVEEIHEWAAHKIQKAIRRYLIIQKIGAAELTTYLNTQSKKLFDECCKCIPLVSGPATSEDGVVRLAGPNIPKILRLLRSKKNIGMDLLTPHGISQSTAMHVACQRGYTELVKELLNHWTEYPMESPHQVYSFQLLHELFLLLQHLRHTKALLSESNTELHHLINQIGVPFDRVCEQLDKKINYEVTILDLLKICGHPLVLSKDITGNTPLHYAAEGGYLTLCKLLIDYGAKINEQNKAGETPLHFAISSKHEEVCMFLVKSKADVSISRYVTLTLFNNVTLRGTFVDAPNPNEECKVMPIVQSRSKALMNAMKEKHQSWFSWGKKKKKHDNKNTNIGNNNNTLQSKINGSNSICAVRPDPNHEDKSAPIHHHNAIMGSLHFSNVDGVVESNGGDDGNGISGGNDMCTRVNSIRQYSPAFRDRPLRDILFFRTSPCNPLIRPNMLCVFLVGEHLTAHVALKTRARQAKGKLLHLLIENLPHVAVIAMDSFRTPLFRCNLEKGTRDFHQRWIVDNHLIQEEERRTHLFYQMKRKNEIHLQKQRQKIQEIHLQKLFSPSDAEYLNKDSIICEPKGILYEYVYDTAEFRGGQSPTLDLVIRTECKELMYHPWVDQLLDHKWNSFGRQNFRSEFHMYSIYFVSFFVATYLHVGDTFLGMPFGGFRGSFWTSSSSSVFLWMEFIRDFAKLVYSFINLHFTRNEYRCYKEKGSSLKAYFRDGWNFFDFFQIFCVWFLNCTEIVNFIVFLFCSDSLNSSKFENFYKKNQKNFELKIYQETMYSSLMIRQYNLETTLLCIIGPQIFIKWIQFARGNQLLGPFVRMIFKMAKDIFVFLIVFLVFLWGFAFAFFILQVEGFQTYFSSIINVFQMSLGQWEWENIRESGPLAILLFLIYVVIGTIMLLNLLIAMLGKTYDDVWEDRHLFFYLERAKATLSIQTSLDNDIYDEKIWCQRLYVLEGDKPIEGIQFQKF